MKLAHETTATGPQKTPSGSIIYRGYRREIGKVHSINVASELFVVGGSNHDAAPRQICYLAKAHRGARIHITGSQIYQNRQDRETRPTRERYKDYH